MAKVDNERVAATRVLLNTTLELQKAVFKTQRSLDMRRR